MLCQTRLTSQHTIVEPSNSNTAAATTARRMVNAPDPTFADYYYCDDDDKKWTLPEVPIAFATSFAPVAQSMANAEIAKSLKKV